MTSPQASRAGVVCAPMTPATRPGAERVLGEFLGHDAHYRASASAYGDEGPPALARALDLFIARPEIGFVWLASIDDDVVGVCVVCYAISTSRGAVVAKLDDVTIVSRWRRQGAGSAMLEHLRDHLRRAGIGRIDTACHRGNPNAWRFYERQGYRPLGEERIALVL